MNQPRVHFNLPTSDDGDRSGAAYARFVVAVDVGAHRQLGLLFKTCIMNGVFGEAGPRRIYFMIYNERYNVMSGMRLLLIGNHQ